MTQNPDSDNSRTQKGHAAVSAHADYRHEDYFFARHQSRAAEALEWQDDDDAETGPGPGLIVAVVLLVVCGLGLMLWEESVGYAETNGSDAHRPLIERSTSHFDMRVDPEYSFLPDALTMLKDGQDLQPLFIAGLGR